MASKLPAIPSIDSRIPTEMQRVLKPMKQILETAVEAGIKGEESPFGGSGVSKDDVIKIIDGQKDLSIPPAPTGFKATGSFGSIILEWNDPGYRNHGYAEIWRSEADNFTTAVLIGQSPGILYTDAIGTSQTVYYWIRFVSKTDVAGPYNAVSGTKASTSLDPDYAMDVLSSAYGEAPFFRLDVPTTIDGVSLPAGIYMKSAYIGDGTIKRAKIGLAAIDTARIADGAIVNAKIENGAVTSAKIGTAQINTGHIQDAAIARAKIQDAAIDAAKIADAAITSAKISETISSSNYSSTAGWRIDKTGTAVFNQLTARGTLQSSNYSAGSAGWRITNEGAAEFNNLFARGTVQSLSYVPGASGWQINSNGNAEFNNVTVRGNIDALTFNGQVIDTFNVKPQAITKGAVGQRYGNGLQWLYVYAPASGDFAIVTYRIIAYIDDGPDGLERITTVDVYRGSSLVDTIKFSSKGDKIQSGAFVDTAVYAGLDYSLRGGNYNYDFRLAVVVHKR